MPTEIQEVRNAFNAYESMGKFSPSSCDDPLAASCVFHYELEFIHPFHDGNGRIGIVSPPAFRKNYLHPAMNARLVEMTNPESPNAKNQKYILSGWGRNNE